MGMPICGCIDGRVLYVNGRRFNIYESVVEYGPQKELGGDPASIENITVCLKDERYTFIASKEWHMRDAYRDIHITDTGYRDDIFKGFISEHTARILLGEKEEEMDKEADKGSDIIVAHLCLKEGLLRVEGSHHKLDRVTHEIGKMTFEMQNGFCFIVDERGSFEDCVHRIKVYGIDANGENNLQADGYISKFVARKLLGINEKGLRAAAAEINFSDSPSRPTRKSQACASCGYRFALSPPDLKSYHECPDCRSKDKVEVEPLNLVGPEMRILDEVVRDPERVRPPKTRLMYSCEEPTCFNLFYIDGTGPVYHCPVCFSKDIRRMGMVQDEYDRIEVPGKITGRQVKTSSGGVLTFDGNSDATFSPKDEARPFAVGDIAVSWYLSDPDLEGHGHMFQVTHIGDEQEIYNENGGFEEPGDVRHATPDEVAAYERGCRNVEEMGEVLPEPVEYCAEGKTPVYIKYKGEAGEVLFVLRKHTSATGKQFVLSLNGGRFLDRWNGGDYYRFDTFAEAKAQFEEVKAYHERA